MAITIPYGISLKNTDLTCSYNLVKTKFLSSHPHKWPKEVLKNHDVECCTKPKLHAQKKLIYNFLTITFSSYNDSWRQMPKLFMTELFIKSKMQSFECTRKVNVTQLMNSNAQNSPNSIDLSEKALTLTYSIIYHIAFSRDYEEMKGGKGQNWLLLLSHKFFSKIPYF